MIEYKMGNRIKQFKQETNLSKAEVRLFFYFLLNSKIGLKQKKLQEFQAILDTGVIPEETGYVMKNGISFCIRETHPGYYVFYVGVEEETSGNKKIRNWLQKVK